MAALLAEYQWAFEVSPRSQTWLAFYLGSTLYHNLKVYLKTQGDRAQVGTLIVPNRSLLMCSLEHLRRPFLRSIAQPLWRKK